MGRCSGRVLRVVQESEAAVAIGTPLVEVANAEDLEVVVDVLSTEATQIVAGALVRIDAGSGRVLPGRVRRVEPAAFTKVSALLDMSHVQLDAYLEATETALRTAMAGPKPPAAPVTRARTG